MIDNNNMMMITETQLQGILQQALQATRGTAKVLKGEGMTLNEFYYGVFQNTQIENAETTIQTNNAWYNASIKKRFGERLLTSITYEELQEYISTLDLSYSTLCHYKGLLRHIFSYALKQGYVDSNPAGELKIPRVKQREHQNKLPATVEHYKRLYEVSKDDWCGIIIPLLFETGMRKEEILGLEWSDIHDGLIHITKAYTGLKGGRSKAILKETKNKGSIRTVPVTATLEKALRRHKALQGNKTFVVSKKDTNERMKPSFFDDKFRKYRQKAMIVENITPHSCRHFYASQLFAHGIPVNEGMRLTGHTTLKTYMLYAYVDKPSETTTDKLLKAMQDISPIEI